METICDEICGSKDKDILSKISDVDVLTTVWSDVQDGFFKEAISICSKFHNEARCGDKKRAMSHVSQVADNLMEFGERELGFVKSLIKDRFGVPVRFDVDARVHLPGHVYRSTNEAHIDPGLAIFFLSASPDILSTNCLERKHAGQLIRKDNKIRFPDADISKAIPMRACLSLLLKLRGSHTFLWIVFLQTQGVFCLN